MTGCRPACTLDFSLHKPTSSFQLYYLWCITLLGIYYTSADPVKRELSPIRATTNELKNKSWYLVWANKDRGYDLGMKIFNIHGMLVEFQAWRRERFGHCTLISRVHVPHQPHYDFKEGTSPLFTGTSEYFFTTGKSFLVFRRCRGRMLDISNDCIDPLINVYTEDAMLQLTPDATYDLLKDIKDTVLGNFVFGIPSPTDWHDCIDMPATQSLISNSIALLSP